MYYVEQLQRGILLFYSFVAMFKPFNITSIELHSNEESAEPLLVMRGGPRFLQQSGLYIVNLQPYLYTLFGIIRCQSRIIPYIPHSIKRKTVRSRRAKVEKRRSIPCQELTPKTFNCQSFSNGHGHLAEPQGTRSILHDSNNTCTSSTYQPTSSLPGW
jgi:hypothetical protein